MDGSRRVANTVLTVARGRAARSGHRGPRTIALLLVTTAAFCVLTGTALAARPSAVQASGLFTIEKLQRIAGSDADYTTQELTAVEGQTVEYEIIVKNISDSTLEFEPLEDENCSGISPAGETEIEAGESEIFTCEEELSEPGLWSNQAEIESGEETAASNTVYVEVAEEPEFAVEKLQKIKGADSGFTANELTGTVGQTVEYEIIVANTGNVPVSFSPLEDANCTGITPAGATELDVGDSESFTCEHTLTKPGQFWENTATVSSGETSEDSNTVVVRTLEEPEFTIEKLQRVDGTETAFTSGEVTAAVGQVIDYEILVSNTGNRPLAFSPLSDPNCTNISPAEATELEPDESEAFTCQHTLTSAGEWSNVAEIEGEFQRQEVPEAVHAHARARLAVGGGVIKKVSSNKVIAKVPAEPEFEIEKLQTIKGSGAGFTKAELQGSAGQTVEYEIAVHNTGNVPLALSALTDANCSSISPSGATELAIGDSETFTCERALTSPGSYANEAAIEGAGKTKTSNRVVLTVPPLPSAAPIQRVQAKCTLSESLIVLHGASGSKHKAFTVHIASLGIKQVTFYLDGHKLKTLTAAQASKGQFSVRINAARLHYGAHRVSVTTVMSESACAAIARAAVFVHPRPAVVKPKFTG